MSITTARDIVEKALVKSNILGSAETPTADMAEDALDTLNCIISEWSINNNMTLARVNESTSIAANTSSIAIGANQTWDTEKPQRVVSSFLRDANNFDYDVEVINRGIYEDINDKTTTGRTNRLFYDPGLTQQANQSGTLFLYPVPDKTYTLFITSDKGLAEFSSLNSNITFPSFYKRALIYNLAIELCPEYGKEIPPLIAGIAERSKNSISALNAKQKVKTKNPGFPNQVNGYNINTGDYDG